MTQESFDKLYLDAQRASCPDDEAILILPDGLAIANERRMPERVTAAWFGHLTPLGATLTDAQLQLLIGDTQGSDSFLLGDSHWKRGEVRSLAFAGGSGLEVSDFWEKAA